MGKEGGMTYRKKSLIWFVVGAIAIALETAFFSVGLNMGLGSKGSFLDAAFLYTSSAVTLFSLAANILSIYFGIRSWQYEKKLCEWVVVSALIAAAFLVVAVRAITT